MTKTTTTGTVVEIKAISKLGTVWAQVAVDGKIVGTVLGADKLPRPQTLGSKVVTHVICNVGLTPEEAEELEREQKALRDAMATPAAYQPSEERRAISRMFEAADRLRDYPGDYYRSRQKAEAALQTWREKNPEEAAKEEANRKARREAEKARRAEELADSFIGRGLD